MTSRVTLAGRTVTIALPAEAGASPWRVLVLHDGQNLFDDGRAFVPERSWEVVRAVGDAIASDGLPPTLVVGIDHAGDRRIREFGYGAAGYGRFVLRDVLGHVRRTYPVSREAADTWMGGSSMGALVSLDIAAHHPGVFGRLYIFSPSVWWRRRAILRTVRSPGRISGLFTRSQGIRDDVEIWLSIGLKEGAEAVDDARRLHDVLLDMRRGDASNIVYREFPDGAHTEQSWAAQLPEALRAFGHER